MLEALIKVLINSRGLLMRTPFAGVADQALKRLRNAVSFQRRRSISTDAHGIRHCAPRFQMHKIRPRILAVHLPKKVSFLKFIKSYLSQLQFLKRKKSNLINSEVLTAVYITNAQLYLKEAMILIFIERHARRQERLTYSIQVFNYIYTA
jgi:hypothetical protein